MSLIDIEPNHFERIDPDAKNHLYVAFSITDDKWVGGDKLFKFGNMTYLRAGKGKKQVNYWIVPDFVFTKSGDGWKKFPAKEFLGIED